jgi:hypothetical protein
MYAYEAQTLTRVSGALYTEALVVLIQVQCWQGLGHYNQSLSLCIVAKHLLGLCGMSDSTMNLEIMSTQAEVHKCKSEYSETWKIHTEMVQISVDRETYWHAGALVNLAEVGVLMGVPKHDVQQNNELARKEFTTMGLKPLLIYCDCVLADLYLREQDLLGAKTLFKRLLKLTPEYSAIK